MSDVICLNEIQAANILNEGLYEYVQLLPMRLSDGRYAVSANTLQDRRHSAYWPILKAGSVEDSDELTFTGQNTFRITVDSKEMYLSAATVGHAFQVPAADTYRFEIHQDESGYVGDPGHGNRRSELICETIQYSAEDTLWSSFSFTVGPEHNAFDVQPPNKPSQPLQAIHQWHSVDTTPVRAPVFAVTLLEGNFRIATRSDTTGIDTAVTHYAQPRPADGVPHHVVVSGLLGEFGHLTVWLDGTQIVDLDTPIGYYLDDRPLAYCHYGIYATNRPDTTIIYHSNIEWGLDDLSDRVANPLVVNVPPGGWV